MTAIAQENEIDLAGRLPVNGSGDELDLNVHALGQAVLDIRIVHGQQGSCVSGRQHAGGNTTLDRR